MTQRVTADKGWQQGSVKKIMRIVKKTEILDDTSSRNDWIHLKGTNVSWRKTWFLKNIWLPAELGVYLFQGKSEGDAFRRWEKLKLVLPCYNIFASTPWRTSDWTVWFIDVDFVEYGTVFEGRASNGSDRVRDGDAGEAGTAPEGIASNGSDSVRDGVVIRAFITRISNDFLYILIK